MSVLIELGSTEVFDALSLDAFPGLREQAAVRFELGQCRVPLLLLALGLGAAPALGLLELDEFQRDGPFPARDVFAQGCGCRPLPSQRLEQVQAFQYPFTQRSQVLDLLGERRLRRSRPSPGLAAPRSRFPACEDRPPCEVSQEMPEIVIGTTRNLGGLACSLVRLTAESYRSPPKYNVIAGRSGSRVARSEQRGASGSVPLARIAPYPSYAGAGADAQIDFQHLGDPRWAFLGRRDLRAGQRSLGQAGLKRSDGCLVARAARASSGLGVARPGG